MFRVNRGLACRVEKLAKKWASIPEPTSPEELARWDERRLELCRFALAGKVSVDVTAEERLLFAKMVFYAPVVRSLVDEGIIDVTGAPGGATAGEDDVPEALHDVVTNGDDGDDEEPAWRP